MKDDDTVSTAGDGRAMQKVLQAERDAERAIRVCEKEARQIVEAAQLEVQRLYARTDQRITNMEMRHDHKLDRLIKQIEKEGAAELRNDAGRNYDQQQLRSVIGKLAVELCGRGGRPAK
jgi:vacuolar-type H+-ATPase subunit H